MQHYIAPEGFSFDENTGLYYKYDYIDEQHGGQTCWITWFDADTGEYSQQCCEISDSTGEANDTVEIDPPEINLQPESEEGQYLSPEGFELDDESRRYFKIDYVNEDDGSITKWITWFDCVSGEYTQENINNFNPSYESSQTQEINIVQQEVESVEESSLTEEYNIDKMNLMESDNTDTEINSEELFDQENYVSPEVNLQSESEDEQYLPPEGFQLDGGSGLYYSIYTYDDELGNTVDFVTWFDTQTGEYAQVEYLIKDYQYTEQSLPIPEEITVKEDFNEEEFNKEDNRSTKPQKQILALCVLIVAIVIGITWHYGIFDNINFPFIGHEKETDKEVMKSAETCDCSLQVQIISPEEAVIKLEVPNMKSNYPAYDSSRDDGDMICDWEVLFGEYSVALNSFNEKSEKGEKVKPEEMQSYLWQYEKNGDASTIAELDETNIEGNVIEWTVDMPIEDFDFNNIKKYKVQIMNNGNITSSVFNSEDVVNTKKILTSSFSHTSLYSLLADEDEDYIYTINQSEPYLFTQGDEEMKTYEYIEQQTDPNWRPSTYNIGGEIYRIKKNDKNAVPEKIISLGDDIKTASSIAVIGNYIYFSSKINNDTNQYAYFKAPKKGGEVEHIFDEDEAFMRGYEGDLYLLFSDRNEYGCFNTKKEEMKYVNIDTTKLCDVLSGGAKSEFHMFKPFSICDDEMYLGGSYDYIAYYSRINLADGNISRVGKFSLLDIDSSDEDFVSAYGVNPIYYNNHFIVNEDLNAFLCRISEDLIAVDKSNNGAGLVFKSIKTNGDKLDINQVFDMKLSDNSKPYAAVGNWILLNDKAICIESQKIKKTIWFKDEKDKTKKWNLEQVEKMTY
ncbi:hypothetical protein [Anaerovorax odorimutans]|uniref:hypothetical protein n=1 Tax=Anaerovorax odorimutans TaxID=109327 RepID=UPI00041D3EB0|nr:hypothetical protein [Anaerovorax odorimutans]